MNNVAFNALYKRLVFSAPSEMEVVRTKGINSLRMFRSLNIDRVKYLVKTIFFSDRAAIGNAVSETAGHHLIVAYHICKYWRRTSWQSKTCVDLVTTGALFEEAERQMELERNLDNDQSISRAFTDSKLNKNFNVLYE